MQIQIKLASLLLTLALANAVVAKEWRGIVPLHSTRTDVTRLLGESPDANSIRSKYSLKSQEVLIVFASQDLYGPDCLKRLPPETVLLVLITPKLPLKFSDSGFDVENFRKFDPSRPKDRGYEGFVDDVSGLVIRAFKGAVEEIFYIASSEDKHLCPAYYANPEEFVRIFID
jgi:hypothetical protein